MSARWVALLAMGMVWSLSGCADPNEPKFEGRGLSSWRWDYRSSDPEKREKAAIAFASIGTPALEDLAKALQDEDPSVRTRAVMGLRDMAEAKLEGDQRAAVLNLLVNSLSDQTTNVRLVAVDGLTAMGEPGIKAIADSIPEQGEFIKANFVDILEKHGKPYPDVVIPALKEVYEKEKSDRLRERAKDAIYVLTGEELPSVLNVEKKGSKKGAKPSGEDAGETDSSSS